MTVRMFQELYLDNNDFKVIPSGSLNGPESLKILSIRSNHIGKQLFYATYMLVIKICDCRFHQIGLV